VSSHVPTESVMYASVRADAVELKFDEMNAELTLPMFVYDAPFQTVAAVGTVAPGAAAGDEEVHAEPFEVKMLPDVPGEVRPVPPFPTGSVPVTPLVRETLLIVLLEPEMVLLVSVWVAASETSVSEEATGKYSVFVPEPEYSVVLPTELVLMMGAVMVGEDISALLSRTTPPVPVVDERPNVVCPLA